MANPSKKEIKVIIKCPCDREKELPKTFIVDANSSPAPAEIECPYCEKLIKVNLPNTTIEDGSLLRGGFKKN